MQGFIIEILTWRSWKLLAFFDREFTAPYQALLNRTTSILTQGHPWCEPSADRALLESFDRHVDRVRSAVPKERLLEFRARDGWKPLCEYLNIAVPNTDYPHLNSRHDALKLEKSLYWSRWSWVAWRMARKLGVTTLVLAITLWCYYKKHRLMRLG